RSTVIIVSSFNLIEENLSYASGSDPKRVITNLIHRDSVLSPYYNPKDTIADRVERSLEISAARLAYFQAKSSLDVTRDLRFDLIPSFPMIFVNFSLGDPPVPQLTVMDTGSNLLWVQCVPCKNCSQTSPLIFDPIKSSTYSKVPCNTSYCKVVPGGRCGSSDQCVYNQTYYDGPSSKGELAREQLMFRTSDDGTVAVSNVVFGCGHENGKYWDEKFTGVLGLGSQLISVPSRLGSGFSYCIGNLFDQQYAYNKLILGEGAIIEGDSTPVKIIDGLYHITLEGISFGEKMLDIDLGVFSHRTQRIGNSIIDSGTTVTWLVLGAYKALFDEVKGLLEGVLEIVDRKPLRLCYQGSASRDLVGFPAVTFHFIDGAELSLDTGSLFYQAGDVFCMAIAPSEFEGLSIIGLMAQQYYNVAYDVAGARVYFQRIECALLDD
ncbi:hypothetical protein CRG98_001094, partial [Punica granatum]